jgi:hypothetical protein
MSIKIQGDLRVVMSRTELKMQPTIHLESKAGYLPHPYPGLRSKCIVGCIFFYQFCLGSLLLVLI